VAEGMVAVVGLAGEQAARLAPPALEALSGASLVAGGPECLQALEGMVNPRAVLPIGADLAAALDAIAGHPGRVAVVASGDPGFFGIVRALGSRLGPDRLKVYPAPSSVALAFARLGLHWDDALVVSAHGRPLEDAARLAATHPKVAVLTSPQATPQALGAALLELGARHDRAAVCTRLGQPDERMEVVDLAGLAQGRWEPRSVVVVLQDIPQVGGRSLAWGLPDQSFAHRGGMVTKAEVRAIVLGKLELPEEGVLWDVGAGCASVAIEAARLSPRLQVVAVERRPDDAARARANVAAHRVAVKVVAGGAPGVLKGLPSPDRAFVGGGGIDVLDTVLSRLRPGGRVVATFAALDRAAEAAHRLGEVVQVGLARGRALPDGGLRLAAENPVFVAWGPGTLRPSCSAQPRASTPAPPSSAGGAECGS
jgi:precorrin-6Y C5,15-methyltransferase (decarboxylating)